MAQARRIKPKTKKAKVIKKPRKPLNLPWGVMAVILVSAVVLISLFISSRDEGSSFGAGLNAFFDQSPPVEGSDEAIASLIEEKAADKTFSFYDILKDDEQFMPDDLPDSVPVRPDANTEFYLQAASFINEADAEKLRANLALKGFKSKTQARTNKDVIYYRVRLGPFSDKRKAKNAKTKLQKIGVQPFMYTVKKDQQ